jgi:hypothetical protein
MPETLTLGHVLLVLTALAALYGLTQFALSMRYAGPEHGRGTPGYARARDARRYTIWGGALALAFLLLAQLTPLGRVALL